MRLVALAGPVWRVCDFCLIFVPFGHYDEPEILSYAIPLFCSIGADVRQYKMILLRVVLLMVTDFKLGCEMGNFGG